MTGDTVNVDDIISVSPKDDVKPGERPAWHNLVIKLHLGKESIEQIADHMEVDREEIACIITSDWGRRRIMQAALDDDEAVQNALAAVQLDCIYNLVHTMETTDNDRLKAQIAKDLMHQGIGKPKQSVHNTTNTPTTVSEELVDAELAQLTGQTKQETT